MSTLQISLDKSELLLKKKDGLLKLICELDSSLWPTPNEGGDVLDTASGDAVREEVEADAENHSSGSGRPTSSNPPVFLALLVQKTLLGCWSRVAGFRPLRGCSSKALERVLAADTDGGQTVVLYSFDSGRAVGLMVLTHDRADACRVAAVADHGKDLHALMAPTYPQTGKNRRSHVNFIGVVDLTVRDTAGGLVVVALLSTFASELYLMVAVPGRGEWHKWRVDSTFGSLPCVHISGSGREVRVVRCDISEPVDRRLAVSAPSAALALTVFDRVSPNAHNDTEHVAVTNPDAKCVTLREKVVSLHSAAARGGGAVRMGGGATGAVTVSDRLYQSQCFDLPAARFQASHVFPYQCFATVCRHKPLYTVLVPCQSFSCLLHLTHTAAGNEVMGKCTLIGALVRPVCVATVRTAPAAPARPTGTDLTVLLDQDMRLLAFEVFGDAASATITRPSALSSGGAAAGSDASLAANQIVVPAVDGRELQKKVKKKHKFMHGTISCTTVIPVGKQSLMLLADGMTAVDMRITQAFFVGPAPQQELLLTSSSSLALNASGSVAALGEGAGGGRLEACIARLERLAASPAAARDPAVLPDLVFQKIIPSLLYTGTSQQEVFLLRRTFELMLRAAAPRSAGEWEYLWALVGIFQRLLAKRNRNAGAVYTDQFFLDLAEHYRASGGGAPSAEHDQTRRALQEKVLPQLVSEEIQHVAQSPAAAAVAPSGGATAVAALRDSPKKAPLPEQQFVLEGLYQGAPLVPLAQQVVKRMVDTTTLSNGVCVVRARGGLGDCVHATGVALLASCLDTPLHVWVADGQLRIRASAPSPRDDDGRPSHNALAGTAAGGSTTTASPDDGVYLVNVQGFRNQEEFERALTLSGDLLCVVTDDSSFHFGLACIALLVARRRHCISGFFQLTLPILRAAVTAVAPLANNTQWLHSTAQLIGKSYEELLRHFLDARGSGTAASVSPPASTVEALCYLLCPEGEEVDAAVLTTYKSVFAEEFCTSALTSVLLRHTSRCVAAMDGYCGALSRLIFGRGADRSATAAARERLVSVLAAAAKLWRLLDAHLPYSAADVAASYAACAQASTRRQQTLPNAGTAVSQTVVMCFRVFALCLYCLRMEEETDEDGSAGRETHRAVGQDTPVLCLKLLQALHTMRDAPLPVETLQRKLVSVVATAAVVAEQEKYSPAVSGSEAAQQQQQQLLRPFLRRVLELSGVAQTSLGDLKKAYYTTFDKLQEAMEKEEEAARGDGGGSVRISATCGNWILKAETLVDSLAAHEHIDDDDSEEKVTSAAADVPFILSAKQNASLPQWVGAASAVTRHQGDQQYLFRTDWTDRVWSAEMNPSVLRAVCAAALESVRAAPAPEAAVPPSPEALSEELGRPLYANICFLVPPVRLHTTLTAGPTAPTATPTLRREQLAIASGKAAPSSEAAVGESPAHVAHDLKLQPWVSAPALVEPAAAKNGNNNTGGDPSAPAATVCGAAGPTDGITEDSSTGGRDTSRSDDSTSRFSSSSATSSGHRHRRDKTRKGTKAGEPAQSTAPAHPSLDVASPALLDGVPRQPKERAETLPSGADVNERESAAAGRAPTLGCYSPEGVAWWESKPAAATATAGKTRGRAVDAEDDALDGADSATSLTTRTSSGSNDTAALLAGRYDLKTEPDVWAGKPQRNCQRRERRHRCSCRRRCRCHSREDDRALSAVYDTRRHSTKVAGVATAPLQTSSALSPPPAVFSSLGADDPLVRQRVQLLQFTSVLRPPEPPRATDAERRAPHSARPLPSSGLLASPATSHARHGAEDSNGQISLLTLRRAQEPAARLRAGLLSAQAAAGTPPPPFTSASAQLSPQYLQPPQPAPRGAGSGLQPPTLLSLKNRPDGQDGSYAGAAQGHGDRHPPQDMGNSSSFGPYSSSPYHWQTAPQSTPPHSDQQQPATGFFPTENGWSSVDPNPPPPLPPAPAAGGYFPRDEDTQEYSSPPLGLPGSGGGGGASVLSPSEQAEFRLYTDRLKADSSHGGGRRHSPNFDSAAVDRWRADRDGSDATDIPPPHSAPGANDGAVPATASQYDRLVREQREFIQRAERILEERETSNRELYQRVLDSLRGDGRSALLSSSSPAEGLSPAQQSAVLRDSIKQKNELMQLNSRLMDLQLQAARASSAPSLMPRYPASPAMQELAEGGLSSPRPADANDRDAATTAAAETQRYRDDFGHAPTTFLPALTDAGTLADLARADTSDAAVNTPQTRGTDALSQASMQRTLTDLARLNEQLAGMNASADMMERAIQETRDAIRQYEEFEAANRSAEEGSAALAAMRNRTADIERRLRDANAYQAAAAKATDPSEGSDRRGARMEEQRAWGAATPPERNWATGPLTLHTDSPLSPRTPHGATGGGNAGARLSAQSTPGRRWSSASREVLAVNDGSPAPVPPAAQSPEHSRVPDTAAAPDGAPPSRVFLAHKQVPTPLGPAPGKTTAPLTCGSSTTAAGAAKRLFSREVEEPTPNAQAAAEQRRPPAPHAVASTPVITSSSASAPVRPAARPPVAPGRQSVTAAAASPSPTPAAPASSSSTSPSPSLSGGLFPPASEYPPGLRPVMELGELATAEPSASSASHGPSAAVFFTAPAASLNDVYRGAARRPLDRAVTRAQHSPQARARSVKGTRAGASPTGVSRPQGAASPTKRRRPPAAPAAAVPARFAMYASGGAPTAAATRARAEWDASAASSRLSPTRRPASRQSAREAPAARPVFVRNDPYKERFEQRRERNIAKRISLLEREFD